MTGFLEHLLAHDLRPGSAVGDQAWPAWVFLLPDLAPAAVRVLGEAPAPVLEALSTLGATVTSRGIADVIVAGAGASGSALTEAAATAPDACVVVLPGAARPSAGNPVVRLGPESSRSVADERLGEGRRAGLAVPTRGARQSVPVRVALRTLRVAGREVGRDVGAARRWRPGGGPANGDVVLMNPVTDRHHGPPRYVRACGLTGGTDWSVVGLAEGPTDRAVFLPGASGDPVVKVALGRRAGAYLTREERVLQALQAHPAIADAVPRVLDVHRRGRAVTVAQSALPGATFRDRGTGTPVGPLLGAGLDALHRLANATARRDPGALRGPLEALVDVFATGFGAGAVVDRLRADVDAYVSAAPPVVALHGDPRPENLLVHDGARIGFVNWEHGESAGPPTWDLFHLLLEDVRMWLGRRGRSVAPRALARQLVGRGDWSHRLHRELARASGELGFTMRVNGSLIRLGLAALACRDLPWVRADAPRESTHYQLLAEVVARLEDSEDHLVP